MIRRDVLVGTGLQVAAFQGRAGGASLPAPVVRCQPGAMKEEPMVLRYWRGWATRDNADAYEAIASREVLPSIAARDLDGYLGAYLVRRDRGDEVEFATIMRFDSIESVRAFAGEDYEAAYVPERVREVLARFDERSAHFEVVLTPDETS
jgi:antibiotic biosynthesis monooxygenase (ABM) superfamily enzyme